jgi:hypothetical protein
MAAFQRRYYAGGGTTTTLANPMGATDTTFNIASSTGWPGASPANFIVVIDRGTASEEKILCTTESGITVTVATGGRGYDGTSATSHNAGATVSLVGGAIDFDEANQVTNLLGNLTAGQVPVGAGAGSLPVAGGPMLPLAGGTMTGPIIGFEDKGGQVFNVKAYGAKGDGKTSYVGDGNITATLTAFTSASASFVAGDVGKSIIIPGAGAGGATLVTTISAYVSATAVTLTAAASTTVTTAKYAYGTDDTAAIQSALNACNTALGGRVYFPTGQYIVATGPLTLKNATPYSVSIEGETVGPTPGNFSTALTSGTQLIGVDGVNMFNITQGYSHISRLAISLVQGAASTCIGLNLTAFLPVLEDVVVTGYSKAVYSSNSTDVYINRGYFTAAGATASTVAMIEIDNSSGQNASVYISKTIASAPVGPTNSYSVWVHGAANNNSDLTIDSSEIGGGSKIGLFIDATSSTGNLDTHIRGCVFDGVTVAAVRITAATVNSAIDLIGNYFNASGAGGVGVDLPSASAQINVLGNQFINCPTGINITGPNCVVNGNVFLGVTTNGVVCSGASPTIVNNKFVNPSGTSATGSAILLNSGATNATITGNTANGASASWATGLTVSTGCDYFVSIANTMPATICTVPYSFDYASNTHGVGQDAAGNIVTPGIVKSAGSELTAGPTNGPSTYSDNGLNIWVMGDGGIVGLRPNNGNDINALRVANPGVVTYNTTGSPSNTLDDGSGNMTTAGHLTIGNRPAFVAGDKYLIVDSSGNVHVSSLGPAS